MKRTHWGLELLKPDEAKARRERYEALKALGASGLVAWRESITRGSYWKMRDRMVAASGKPTL